jgi:hypothetical protein
LLRYVRDQYVSRIVGQQVQHAVAADEILRAAEAPWRIAIFHPLPEHHAPILAVGVDRMQFAGGHREFVWTKRDREGHEQPLVVRPIKSVHLVRRVELQDTRDVERIVAQHHEDLRVTTAHRHGEVLPRGRQLGFIELGWAREIAHRDRCDAG